MARNTRGDRVCPPARRLLDLDQAGHWRGEIGVIDERRLRTLLDGLDRARSVALTCGPAGTITAVSDRLLDFDITADGQPLATLSGSGKAVANLALRIGLGQVLTNNVLSLFIGDEIDASLDADRSEATGQTLRGLTSSIAQILLVTHKGAEAEYSPVLDAT